MNENIENKEVVETPVELTAGEMLRNARTTGRRKREISTIAKQLCIREEFLSALEEGNYTFIPETVYILGFARNYAMELGLNPDEIVNKIKQEMAVVPGTCATSDAADEEGPTCARPSIKTENPTKAVFVRVYQFIYQHWVWFAGALVAIILAVVAVSVFGTKHADEEVPVVQDVVQVTENLEPKYTTTVRQRFGAENSKKANVIIQANADAGDAGTWVEIKNSRGRTELRQVLLQGDVYYVPVGDKYKATFGNAGGIDIWVNGKLAPRVGDVGARKSGIILLPESLIGDK